jgi:simple sugar transport system ATP-binding protein
VTAPSAVPAVRLHAISKRFGAVAALDGVSVDFAGARVHGLLGENGAGKSTLMHVLYGMLAADAGTIAIAGRPVAIASPRDARRAGIGMVHQHFALVPGLSVADNLALALGSSPRSPGFWRIDSGAWAERVRAAAAGLRWDIDPGALVGGLAVGTQQRVEILKALIGVEATAAAARVLILDEPTAVLTPQEVDELIPALRSLAAAGATVILISHKLREIERACDEVAILRRGRLVHQGPCAGLSRERIAALMVGEGPRRPGVLASPGGIAAWVGDPAGPRRPGVLASPGGIAAGVGDPAERAVTVAGGAVDPAGAPGAGAPGAVRLEVRGLVGAGRRPAFGPCDLAVRAGEIVGIAGVDGNGQGPLVAAVLGVERPAGGTVLVDGVVSGPGRAAAFGVIPDDRRREALVLPMSAVDNLLLKDRRRAPFTRRGWISPRRWRAQARELMARYDVRGQDARPVAELSGGNQQKLVLARELHREPGVIVAVNPTRGLDLRATAAVLARLRDARARGAGILLVHSDLDELLALSDRVLVMVGGTLRDSGWPGCGRAAIGRMMLGAAVVPAGVGGAA